ncbi:NAD(P)-dependent oxidoreductase [Caballeronia novacaledonica]|uniref:NAD(P)-dependent oxidoreductase n=1 Tax=Caballeronia novacaledonica TaxID=1544861 RepID=A0AA37IER5_9BURK|nr:NAD(P)-dependent oxidoreductase [Caballeronia novacaledonica]GJH27384.1 NAD(P)-dependent oxidoreductase [Caballeronia novacaledonica]
MATYGFVGLGAMGKHMVSHMLAKGLAVVVFDRNENAIREAVSGGAEPAKSARDLADRAEVVMICLPTPDIVEAVATGSNGLIEGSKIKVFVDHSTTGPTVARKLADAFAGRNIVSLDAPLAGGVAGAKAGKLSVLVSGAASGFESAKPAFDAFGRNVAHLGEQPGLGQTLKLVNNMIAGAALVTAAEAVLFGVKAGIPAQVILDALSKSATARSFAVDTLLGEKVLSRNFDFGFRMDLMRKDMRLALSEAEAVKSPMLACSVVKQIFDAAIADGFDGEDMTKVVIQLEKLAHAEIKAT